MKKMPKWARVGMYGAALALVVDYFAGPALRKNLKV